MNKWYAVYEIERTMAGWPMAERRCAGPSPEWTMSVAGNLVGSSPRPGHCYEAEIRDVTDDPEIIWSLRKEHKPEGLQMHWHYGWDRLSEDCHSLAEVEAEKARLESEGVSGVEVWGRYPYGEPQWKWL